MDRAGERWRLFSSLSLSGTRTRHVGLLWLLYIQCVRYTRLQNSYSTAEQRPFRVLRTYCPDKKWLPRTRPARHLDAGTPDRCCTLLDSSTRSTAGRRRLGQLVDFPFRGEAGTRGRCGHARTQHGCSKGPPNTTSIYEQDPSFFVFDIRFNRKLEISTSKDIGNRQLP